MYSGPHSCCVAHIIDIMLTGSKNWWIKTHKKEPKIAFFSTIFFYLETVFELSLFFLDPAEPWNIHTHHWKTSSHSFLTIFEARRPKPQCTHQFLQIPTQSLFSVLYKHSRMLNSEMCNIILPASIKSTITMKSGLLQFTFGCLSVTPRTRAHLVPGNPAERPAGSEWWAASWWASLCSWCASRRRFCSKTKQ